MVPPWPWRWPCPAETDDRGARRPVGVSGGPSGTYEAAQPAVRNWAGVAGCVWAIAYIPIHLYWAATASSWPFGELPEWLTPEEWRRANWGASVVIGAASLVCLALARPWGRRLPRPLLGGVAWAGAVFALLHWVVLSTATALKVLGVSEGTVTSFDRWNLFVFEPWFLGMGLLLAAAAINHRRIHDGGSTPAHSAQRRPGLVSPGLVVVGSLVVLVGVMTFEIWLYGVVGPVVVGLGLSGYLLRRGRD